MGLDFGDDLVSTGSVSSPGSSVVSTGPVLILGYAAIGTCYHISLDRIQPRSSDRDLSRERVPKRLPSSSARRRTRSRQGPC